MSDFVQHVAQGDVHVLRLNNPPVNTLRTEIRAGLLAGVNAAKALMPALQLQFGIGLPHPPGLAPRGFFYGRTGSGRR